MNRVLLMAILSVPAALWSCAPQPPAVEPSPGDQVIGVDPAEELVDEAQAARAAGDTQAALRLLTQAIEENPLLFDAHMEVADIHREQGDYEQAERSYRNAVRINPRSFDANFFHGLTLQLLNRLNEAIEAYRRALVINPESHEANLNLAIAYVQTAQPAEALPFAETAAELKPDHGPTHANLGSVYSALGRDQEAVDRYRMALELMEPSPELILNLVDSLRKTGRYAEMVNALDALIRLQPSSAAYERLGFAHFRLQDFEQSKDAYRAALQLDPQYFPAMNGLAVNLLNQWIASQRTDQAARDEAVRLLRRSLQIDRNQPRIVELLSRYG